jgi:hypothetical protein
LTPEAFLAIVLSPASLEAQIASPHALKVEILVSYNQFKQNDPTF